jgi:hypothetical protein
MKPTDFRIGNLIEYDGRVFEIDTIAEEFPTLNTAEFGIGVVSWENIKPIELTEEILFKCVFALNHVFLYKHEGSFWHDTLNGSIEIKYLHQLQNLYYILTGKELEIKI